MKDNMSKIIIISLLVVVGIAIVAGTTFAYYRGYIVNSTSISGQTYEANVSVSITSQKTGNLVPVVDSAILTSLNGNYPCEDTRGYSVCSIYKVDITNSSTALSMNGYIETLTGTTYTASHLKYRLFTKSGNTYTAYSDIGALSYTVGTKNYITSSSNNITFQFSNGTPTPSTSEYYLIIWLSDVSTNQLEDVNKTYNGSLVFQSSDGAVVSAVFTS